jgi:SacI homology domain
VLTIASFSFLLCITRREQVAQIFGKPIYMIKDIAILPVSSRAEAEQAITQTQAELEKVKRPKEDDVAASTSEESGNESFDERSIEDPSEPQTPTHERLHKAAQSESTTNVVQDVIQRKGYGQFASQWFSRRGWGVGNKPAGGSSTDLATAAEKKVEKSQPRAAESTLENDPPLVVLEAPQQDNSEADTASPQRSSNEAAGQMLPKILRTAKLLFISQSFYFSYDFNITKRFGSSSMDSLNSVSPEGFEPLVGECPSCSPVSMLTKLSISGTNSWQSRSHRPDSLRLLCLSCRDLLVSSLSWSRIGRRRHIQKHTNLWRPRSRQVNWTPKRISQAMDLPAPNHSY